MSELTTGGPANTNDRPGRQGPPPRAWSARLAGATAGALAAAGLVIAGAAIVASQHRQQPASLLSPVASVEGDTQLAALDRPTVSARRLEDETGVRLSMVSVSGGGGLIDLRFVVVDPSLAHALHDPSLPPTIVDEATGAVAGQLLMGHAHSGPFTAGHTYYLIFENPGNLIKPGNKVSVLIGGVQVLHVSVN